MKDILLLDLDNTILDFSKAEHEALYKVLEVYNVENTKENHDLYYKINVEYWKKYELHLIDREVLLGLRFEDFFSHFNVEVDGKKVNDLYFSYLSSFAYFMPNCKEFCEECKKRNFKLYYPPLKYCGDNAAMVGAQGIFEFESGNISGAELNATATLPIDYR